MMSLSFDNGALPAKDAGNAMPLSPQELVFARYKAIDIENQEEWGSGLNVKPILSDRATKVWDAMLGHQALRNDKGHTEVVTYLAHSLCQLGNLSQENAEVVILASILHDSVDLARKLIYDYPLCDDVVTIIADHETRQGPFPADGLYRYMWDAEILWRVTSTGFKANDLLTPKTAETAFRYMHAELEFSAKKLSLPISLHVGRIELAQTMIRLFKPEELPRDFIEQYQPEIVKIIQDTGAVPH